MADDMTVVFLGSGLNPLSIACLEAVTAAGSAPVVGIASATGTRPVASVRKALAQFGVAAVARRAAGAAVARTRLLLRRAGARLEGHRSLAEVALARGLRTLSVDHVNSERTVAQLRSLQPDLIVVAAFRQILKNEVIAIPRLGCVNVHPSLLPAYRGPNPYYWVLRNGEVRSGVTVHFIGAGVDTGDIIAQEALDVALGDTELSLQARSGVLAARLLRVVLAQFAGGAVPRRVQVASGVSYFPLPPRGASTL